MDTSKNDLAIPKPAEKKEEQSTFKNSSRIQTAEGWKRSQLKKHKSLKITGKS